ncbi:hypothetical protein CDAR_379151 [Caerostris darwini]|uniref:Uncharacterized protein n=1 Tax=Caerostris darwini TaxID=1538125 RepID=A0AAV4S959_9ARAC|nr:hypothetical protein CDAR_379151 [Caerostris darwini]
MLVHLLADKVKDVESCDFIKIKTLPVLFSLPRVHAALQDGRRQLAARATEQRCGQIHAQEPSVRLQVPPVHDSLQQPGDGGAQRGGTGQDQGGRYCFFLFYFVPSWLLSVLGEQAVWFAGL